MSGPTTVVPKALTRAESGYLITRLAVFGMHQLGQLGERLQNVETRIAAMEEKRKKGLAEFSTHPTLHQLQQLDANRRNTLFYPWHIDEDPTREALLADPSLINDLSVLIRYLNYLIEVGGQLDTFKAVVERYQLQDGTLVENGDATNRYSLSLSSSTLTQAPDYYISLLHSASMCFRTEYVIYMLSHRGFDGCANARSTGTSSQDTPLEMVLRRVKTRADENDHELMPLLRGFLMSPVVVTLVPDDDFNFMPASSVTQPQYLPELMMWIASGKPLTDERGFTPRLGFRVSPEDKVATRDHREIVCLLNSYLADPRQAIFEARISPEERPYYPLEHAAALAAMVVFYCDGLVNLNFTKALGNGDPTLRDRINNFVRFMTIASGLPMELQFTLALRAAGSLLDGSKLTPGVLEPAFRWLARYLMR